MGLERENPLKRLKMFYSVRRTNCRDMEFVLLKSFIPKKTVSGSELLYSPVGYINMYDSFFGSSYFAADDTVVDIYRDYSDPRCDQVTLK